MIKMCLITPTSYLYKFAHQSDGMHLCLAHLIEEGNDYTAWYRTRKELGEYIIMDNGAFELGESMPAEQLLAKAAILQPNAIVLPDYPGQHWNRGVVEAQNFMNKAEGTTYDWFFVPQSEKGDMGGWLEAYDWASDEERIKWIGMSILGIPNAWNRVPPHLSRYYCGEYLLTNNLVSSKAHHYLGSFGYPNEYQLLAPQGIAYSSDTSSPVWHGHHGIAYDNTRWGLKNGKLPTKVHFEAPYLEDKVETIQTNINYLKHITGEL